VKIPLNLFFSSKPRILHDSKWMTELAFEFHSYQRIDKYIKSKNVWLSEFSLPKLDVYHHKSKDTLSYISKTLHESKLANLIAPLHPDLLPINHKRDTKWVMVKLRDSLIRQVPTARWKVYFAWYSVRKEKSLDKAIQLFLFNLKKAIKGNSYNSQKLKDYLSENLEAVLGKIKNINSRRFNGIYEESRTQYNNTSFDSATWQLTSIGIEANYSFRLSQLAHTKHFELNNSDKPLDLFHDTLSGETAFENLDILDGAEVSLPIITIIKNAHKQMMLIWNGHSSILNGATSFTVTVLSTSTGIIAGGMLGKAIGSLIGASVDITTAGVFGGSITGGLLGKKVANEILEYRYQKTSSDYNKAEYEMEQAMENAVDSYSEHLGNVLENLQIDLADDFKYLSLAMPDSSPITNIKKSMIEALKKDIDFVTQKIATTNSSLEFNEFITQNEALIDKLKNSTPLTTAKLIYNFRNIPILRKGEFWKNRKFFIDSLSHNNGTINIGIISWCYCIRGLYFNALNELAQEAKYGNENILYQHQLWVATLQKLAEKLSVRKAQL